jgi:hypothetical protein
MHHVTFDRGRLGPGEQGYALNPYEIGWLKRVVVRAAVRKSSTVAAG